nr:hypothetical protein [Tanacetum cinerariifolium]
RRRPAHRGNLRPPGRRYRGRRRALRRAAPQRRGRAGPRRSLAPGAATGGATDDRPERGVQAAAQRDRTGGTERPHRADHRRNRRGQGVGGPPPARTFGARGQADD